MEPGPWQAWPAGAVLYRRGDPAAHLFVVLTGRVLLYGRPQTGGRGPGPRRVAGRGDVIGGEALGEPPVRHETALALTDVSLLALTPEDIAWLKARSPQLTRRLLQAAGLVQTAAGLAAGAPPSPGEPDPLRPADAPGAGEGRLWRLDGPAPQGGFLYRKVASCPACGHRFEVDAVRESKLSVASRDADLRTRYRELEPLWYRIWVCPHCLWSGRRREFERAWPDGWAARALAGLQRRQAWVRQRWSAWAKQGYVPALAEGGEGLLFAQPRDLWRARLSFELALGCRQEAELTEAEVGGLWLAAGWLAEDAGAAEEAAAAREEARRAFRRAYDQGRQRDPAAEQRLAYLLGALSARAGLHQEAAFYLLEAARPAPGRLRLFTEMARERYEELRAARRGGPSAAEAQASEQGHVAAATGGVDIEEAAGS